MGKKAGLRRQGKSAEKHDEHKQMDGCSLRAHPFVIRNEPCQQNIQSPPNCHKKIRAWMLNHSFGIDSHTFLAVKDFGPIEVVRGKDGPIEVGQERQITESPKQTPIRVARTGAGQNVKAECRRQKEDGGPDCIDDMIVENSVHWRADSARVKLSLKFSAPMSQD